MQLQKHSTRQRIAALPVLHESEIGRPKLRRLNPLVANKLDVRVETVFDWAGIVSSTAAVAQTLFSKAQGGQYTPTGGSALTLTKYHTTMLTAGQLVAPEKILVKAIELCPRNDANPQDGIALINLFYMDFLVGQKSYWRGHGFELPAGGGAFITGGASAAAATPPTGTSGTAFGFVNGWPTPQVNLLIDAAPVPSGWGSEHASARSDQRNFHRTGTEFLRHDGSHVDRPNGLHHSGRVHDCGRGGTRPVLVGEADGRSFRPGAVAWAVVQV